MDGTLVSKNTAALYVKYEYEMRRVPFWRVARVAWWHTRYVSGYLNADELAERALAWYVGRGVDELRLDVTHWFERHVKQHVPDAARKCVERHRDAGDVLVVVTGSAAYATECVAHALNIEETVCSEVEIHEGRLTGKLIRPACFGVGKLERTQRWLREHHPELSLAQATFYSDSITDLPLLEAVGNPVAINPDPRLRRIATQRGWHVEWWK